MAPRSGGGETIARVVGERSVVTFAKVIGSVLRAARVGRGLTLRQATTQSRGLFPPTSLASYERGERSISLERFCRLANVYRIPPERLVAEIMRTIEGRPLPVIDLARLETLDSPEARTIREFVTAITELRSDRNGAFVALRLGDLEVLAPATGHRVEDLVNAIGTALHQEPGRENG